MPSHLNEKCVCLIAGIDDDGRRADRVVRRVLENLPLQGVYAALRKGQVKVNGKRVKASERIKKGDEIEIDASVAEQNKVRNCDGIACAPPFMEAVAAARNASFPFGILFQNEHLLVINKPSGISTHGHGSVEEAVLQAQCGKFIAQTKTGGGERSKARVGSLSFRPGPLHRLDRATSGVLVFSQSLVGAKWFTNQMRAHNIHKTYLALLEGEIGEVKQWKDFIAPNKEAKGFYTMQIAGAQAKLAITNVYPIISCRHPFKATFARIVIDTGRKHQIRCQCAFHGHPLIGDTAYGGRPLNHLECGGKHDGNTSLFLHSARIQLPPNDLGVPAVIDAPLTKEFSLTLDNILSGWRLCNIMGGKDDAK